MSQISEVMSRVLDDPYELSTLTLLENNVARQLRERDYNFDANKALIRSYQVNADQVKVDVVADVMVLSLMHLPSTDFLAISYLLPGKLPLQPKLQQIQKFADHLERAEFVEFWELYKSADKSITANAVGFEDSIRNFIVSNTRETFRNISKKLLQQFLGLSDSEIDGYCSKCSHVDQISGDSVTLKEPEVQGKSKQFEARLRLDEALRLVDAVRAGTK